MKLAGHRVEKFLRDPGPAVTAVLLYGPDQGLVRERADRLVATVAGDATDPFRVAELAPDHIKDDRARLIDEAAALSLSGGRRVVRVREGRDALADAVRALLEGAAGGGLVVIEAGELGPRSSLRQIFEGAERAVAIACYLDEGEALRSLIAGELSAGGFGVSGEALDLLAAHLGADRGLTRRELEKLVLYKGETGRIEVDDVLAVIADAGSVSMDSLAYAACGGDTAALDRALAAALAEGVQPIPLLRAVARHLQRLLQARATMAAGGTSKQAVDALRPAIFFRLQPLFRGQLETAGPGRLARALSTVTEAELACKRTGAPQALLCHQALVRVAMLMRSRQPAQ